MNIETMIDERVKSPSSTHSKYNKLEKAIAEQERVMENIRNEASKVSGYSLPFSYKIELSGQDIVLIDNTLDNTGSIGLILMFGGGLTLLLLIGLSENHLIGVGSLFFVKLLVPVILAGIVMLSLTPVFYDTKNRKKLKQRFVNELAERDYGKEIVKLNNLKKQNGEI